MLQRIGITLHLTHRPIDKALEQVIAVEDCWRKGARHRVEYVLEDKASKLRWTHGARVDSRRYKIVKPFVAAKFSRRAGVEATDIDVED